MMIVWGELGCNHVYVCWVNQEFWSLYKVKSPIRSIFHKFGIGAISERDLVPCFCFCLIINTIFIYCICMIYLINMRNLNFYHVFINWTDSWIKKIKGKRNHRERKENQLHVSNHPYPLSCFFYYCEEFVISCKQKRKVKFHVAVCFFLRERNVAVSLFVLSSAYDNRSWAIIIIILYF